MRWKSGCGSGLFKQDHPRSIDRHIDYFGDGVEDIRIEPRRWFEPRRWLEPRRLRRAPGPIEERESVVVIVGPFATRRRPAALAGAR